MKAKGKCFFIMVLLVIMVVVSYPSVALAQSDEYGYNAQARSYKGTLDNWEALLSGLPPTPFDPKGKDIIFVKRKWDKLFDPMIHSSLPLGAGAWQKAELWKYLSGDQLGWTWHLNLEVVYSPNTLICDAIEVPAESIGGEGFYIVERKEWLTEPHGEKTVIEDFSVNSSTVKRALHFGKRRS